MEQHLIPVLKFNDDLHRVSIGIARCKSLLVSMCVWGLMAAALATPVVLLVVIISAVAPSGTFDPSRNVGTWAMLALAALAVLCVEVSLLTRSIRRGMRSYHEELIKASRRNEKTLLREIDHELDALFANDAAQMRADHADAVDLPLKPDAKAAVKTTADRFANELILRAKLEASAENYEYVTANHVDEALRLFTEKRKPPSLPQEFGSPFGGLIAGTAITQFIGELQRDGGARTIFALAYVALLIVGLGFMLSGSVRRR